MIFHKLDKDGGFTAGDSESRMTSYAFPTSTHANRAKQSPMEVAEEMLANETRHGFDHEFRYDDSNWCKLQIRSR